MSSTKKTASSISDTLEVVKSEICDNYCKYPIDYALMYEDSEVAYETMLEDICSECPLNMI